MQTIERHASINGTRVNIVVIHDGDRYQAAAYATDGRVLGEVSRPDPEFSPITVRELQGSCMEEARAELGQAGQTLEQIANEMTYNGEMTTSYRASRQRRRR